MTFFFFLPSILLSGFMFPFRGMPDWAQWLGEVLPLTHFLRIVRGILLKGNGAAEIMPEIWPLLALPARRRHDRAAALPPDARLISLAPGTASRVEVAAEGAAVAAELARGAADLADGRRSRCRGRVQLAAPRRSRASTSHRRLPATICQRSPFRAGGRRRRAASAAWPRTMRRRRPVAALAEDQELRRGAGVSCAHARRRRSARCRARRSPPIDVACCSPCKAVAAMCACDAGSREIAAAVKPARLNRRY